MGDTLTRRIACPHCSAKLNLAAGTKAAKFRCSKCGQTGDVQAAFETASRTSDGPLNMRPDVLAGIGVTLAGVLVLAIGAAIGLHVVAFAGVVVTVSGVAFALNANKEPVVPLPLSTVPVPDAVRQQRLQEYLSADLASRPGGRIESVAPYSAVIVTGQKVNHILHLLISVLLCGLWLPVWLLITVSGGERRRVLAVDQCGNVRSSYSGG